MPVLKTLLLTICLLSAVLSNQVLHAQTNAITVRFGGNAGISLSDGKQTICFDFPYSSGAFGYMRFDSAALKAVQRDAILIFTHRHPDHYWRHHTKFYTGKKYARRNRKKLPKRLPNQVSEVSIQVFRTKHRFCFKHYSYLLEWHGKRFFISGDTEHPETIGKIKNIDYAFVPPWILSYAKAKNISIDAKTKVIYHLYPNEKVEQAMDINDKVLDKLGMEFQVPI